MRAPAWPAMILAALAAASPAAAEIRIDLQAEIGRIIAESRAAEAVAYECSRRTGDIAHADAFRSEWMESVAVAVATLWATDFPADYIAGIAAEGTPLPPPADPSVEDCRAARAVGLPHRPVWKAIAFAEINFGAIRPMTAEGLATVKVALAEVLPRQAEALHCYELIAPSLPFGEATLGAVDSLWRDEVLTIRRTLHDAGWPHDAIDELAGAAMPEALKASPAVAKVTRSECDADRWWLDWLGQFSYARARETVEAVIAAAPVPEP